MGWNALKLKLRIAAAAARVGTGRSRGVRRAALAGLALLISAQATAEIVATIQWHEERQVIDGFGTSQAITYAPPLYHWPEPQRSEILDLAFSAEKGIGLTILRNTIPCGDPDDSVPGLQPSPGEWNYTDTEQVWLMHEAVQRGVTTLFGAVWSPPAWMKTSGVTRGGSLKPEHYQDFAEYLARYAKEYAEANQVEIDAISIANEPDNDTTNWASCGWSNREIATFLADYLAPTFAARGVTAQVVAPEIANWERTERHMRATYETPAAIERVDIVAGHLYGGDPTTLFEGAVEHGKKIWMTEASLRFPVFPIDGALNWARTIHEGLVQARLNAWIWWVLANWPDEGLIWLRNEPPAPPRYLVSKAFWALGNYSKFIRPGYVRIEATPNPADELYVSAFKDPRGDRFVIVAVNTGALARPVRFEPVGFTTRLARPYLTSRNSNLEPREDVSFASTVTVPARSVVTYVGYAASITPETELER